MFNTVLMQSEGPLTHNMFLLCTAPLFHCFSLTMVKNICLACVYKVKRSAYFFIPLPASCVFSVRMLLLCEWPLILPDCSDPYSQTKQNHIKEYTSNWIRPIHYTWCTIPLGPPNTSQECPLWFTWGPFGWKKSIFRKCSMSLTFLSWNSFVALCSSSTFSDVMWPQWKVQ